ncbi:MAG: mechanosensitive ion channel family protein [Alphaproteobacteria bacterium]|nr:mechanosensitive ion channel family protein [Alphaproteobacteria bacterium]
MLKKVSRAVAPSAETVSKWSAFIQWVNKYLLLIIIAILGLYLYLYPEILTKMWKGMRAYSGDAGSKITFEALFQASLFFLCASYIVRRGKKILENKLLSHLAMDTGVKHTIVALLTYCVWFLVALLTLSILGVNLKNLAIVFGALSVGIGFGLQNIVNNFVSGIIILFERPIKEGDWVVINGQEGIVKSIRIRATLLETFDNSNVLIPNADILSGNVINWTHANMNGRVVVPVSVSYDTNLEQARDILMGLAADEPRLLKNPAPYVWVTNFGDNGIDMELRGVTDNVMNKGSIRSDLMFRVFRAFADNHIEIPFPQRVVHLKKEENE